MASSGQPSSSRLLAYLQLMRLPNVFTAMADVLMGFWFTHETLSPLGVFVLLLASSSFLYIGGMVLNDVFDFEQDRRERPHRPLPSDRVPRQFAFRLGVLLLLAGIGAGTCATFSVGNWRPGVIATTLAVAVLLYDRVLKRTPLGPAAMGGCRALNVLLGMSASSTPWTAANWIVAGGIGVYAVGVTWFARREALESKSWHLVGALITVLYGIGMLWWFPQMAGDVSIMDKTLPRYWTPAWALLAILLGWQFVLAIAKPSSGRVQFAVKTAILSIIVLDALVVFGVRGPLQASAILLLLLPAILLGRWVYST